MSKRLGSTLLAILLFSLDVSAQSDCSSLSIKAGDDSALPHQLVTVTVAGSPAKAPVFLVTGPTPGKTTLDLPPLGTLVIGLDRPFATRFLGLADAKGGLVRSFLVPSSIDLTLYGQSVGIEVSRDRGAPPKRVFCTSNVASVDL